MDRHGLEEHELIERLNWLINVRFIAVVAVIALTLAVKFVLDISFEYVNVLLIGTAVFIYNIFFSYLNIRFLRVIKDIDRKAVVAHRFANFQSLLDILALTAILHYTGSIESPFAFYYIFHLVFLGILLSKLATALQGFLALSLFAGLVLAEFTGLIPHIHPAGYLSEEAYRNPVFVAGNLFVLSTTVIFAVGITVSIIGNLRRREAQIIELSDELEKRAVSCEIAYDELQVISLEKARYVRKITHELKSPLAAVESMAHAILGGYVGDVSLKQKQMLQSIVDRTNAMSDLIVDMLILAKSRESLPFKKPEIINMSELISDIIKRTSQDYLQKQLQLNLDLNDTPQITGYKEELTEMMKNLLENAVKYSHEGGRISVVVNSADNGIRIIVSDSGIGMTQQDQAKIFEEFYRSEKAKIYEQEGTGLGLSIVKEVINKHKGHIEVFSKPGKGSTFNVWIPLRTGETR